MVPTIATRRVFAARRAVLVGILALVLTGASAARGDEAADCLVCHGDRVDEGKFAASPHAALGCGACHAGIADYPHPAEVAAPDCAACHGEVATLLRESVHGAADAPGVGCADCHGDVHTLLAGDQPGARVHWPQLAATCARCHGDGAPAGSFRIPVVRPVDAYLKSVHAAAVAAGRHGATCGDCHGSHRVLPGSDPRSPLAPANVPTTCGACHGEALAGYRESVHAEALARGVREAPVCTDCHGEHGIFPHTDPASPVFAANIPGETCGRCHESIRLSAKYGLPPGQVSTFRESYHGLALRSGQLTAANCSSCHGVHDIQPSRDPRSHTHEANLARTCGKCHPGAGTDVALGPVHVSPTTGSAVAIAWIRFVYLWLIGLVVGGMGVHDLLDLVHKARRPRALPRAVPVDQPERMPRVLRVQHGLVMVSFVTLVYTGFALTYPESWWAVPLLHWENELGLRGLLHRVAAVIMLGALGWHAVLLVVSRRLRACLAGLAWSRRDLRDVLGRLAYLLGRRAEPPRAGKFSYVEKVEYWAFLWGSMVMVLTGVVLWFENVSLHYLPKWATDIATAVHFYEAILATLAIAVWHFYWVMFDPEVYPMDTAWLTGRAPAARVLELSEEDAPADARTS